MRRLLLILVLAFVAAVAAAWLADHPGHALITWESWRIEMAAVTLMLLVIGLTVVTLLIFRLLIWLIRDTPFAPERRRVRRQKKGMEAVNDALAAIGAGRGRDASRYAEDAIKNLGVTPLTLVLRVEAAHVRKDVSAAHEALTALAEREDSGILGFRGLVQMAMQRGDIAEARALCVAAQSRDSDSDWVRELSYQLAIKEGRFTEARSSLRDLRQSKIITGPLADQQEAALAYSEALEADLAGKTEDALDLARDALKLDPKLTPAAILGARLARQTGRAGLREGILNDAWKAQPHPDLFRAMIAGIENETPSTRLRAIEAFIGTESTDPLVRILRAELAIEADDIAAAREEMDALIRSGNAPAEAYEFYAALEDSAGNPIAAAEWREEKRSAKPATQWVCESCHNSRDHWSAICGSCNSLGTLSWGNIDPIEESVIKPETFGLITR